MSPRHALPAPDGCKATRELLDRVGDKWSLYTIGSLRQGSLRFNELKRGIEGISQRMLTLTLKSLERDGLVTRTVTPSVPPRVDYALTPLGRTLISTVMSLHRWAERNGSAVRRAREAYDKRSLGGEAVNSPR